MIGDLTGFLWFMCATDNVSFSVRSNMDELFSFIQYRERFIMHEKQIEGKEILGRRMQKGKKQELKWRYQQIFQQLSRSGFRIFSD